MKLPQDRLYFSKLGFTLKIWTDYVGIFIYKYRLEISLVSKNNLPFSIRYNAYPIIIMINKLLITVYKTK